MRCMVCGEQLFMNASVKSKAQRLSLKHVQYSKLIREMAIKVSSELLDYFLQFHLVSY